MGGLQPLSKPDSWFLDVAPELRPNCAAHGQLYSSKPRSSQRFVMIIRSRYKAFFVLLLILPLSGCLFRSRKVVRQSTTAPLKSATAQELIDFINTSAGRIHTMQATVDIATSVGGEKKGKVVDYQEIRGYVLARKPAMLRMIGLMPIVRNRAFDMVSDGSKFKLWIPPKNKFVIGSNEVSRPSANAIEN